MTDDELRVQLMLALHGACIEDWKRRAANGAVAITRHSIELHRDRADALMPIVRRLAEELHE